MPRVSIAPDTDLSTEINVLPLIDILLCLIIVFFLIERNLIFMPAQVPPPEPATGVAGDPQIVLQLKADGSVALNTQPIPAGQLELQLRAAFESRPRKVLFLDVAPERPYQEAISAMDAAREVGIETIAWVPRRAAPGSGSGER